jgi:predicted kinase
VARLIVLNGPPGCGKSTIARLYADDHPLALNLDVDRIRGLLGQWKQRAHQAGLQARAIALAAARAHLTTGRDVVIPQFLGRTDFLEQLEDLAEQVGAEFHEIVLMTTRDEAISRFRNRTRTSPDTEHREADEMITGDPERLAQMYDDLVAVLARRPTPDGQARRVPRRRPGRHLSSCAVSNRVGNKFRHATRQEVDCRDHHAEVMTLNRRAFLGTVAGAGPPYPSWAHR